MPCYKDDIAIALNNLKDCHYDSAIAFWRTLGYRSGRQPEHYSFSFDSFNKATGYRINKNKAIHAEWDMLMLLFQITDEEMSNHFEQPSQTDFLYNGRLFKESDFKSYLFASIRLTGKYYTRSTLADLSRQVNRLYAIPLILMICYDDKISISVIDRRPNKTHKQKDVLEQVTMIKDIALQDTHRAHLDLLYQLSIESLEQGMQRLSSFDELHKAWKTVLSIQTLNKSFYDKITHWYKEAYDTIELPFKPSLSDTEKKETKKHFLVKLLCRMMFCWFIKEKGLINPKILELSDYNDVPYSLLGDGIDANSNSYYRGILHPLFFECLNEPSTERNISSKRKFMQYLSDSFDLNLFKYTPYLNGGIFDRNDEFYQDFCKLDDNVPDESVSIPNKLFYSENGKSGLNQIMKSYKFTIEENTTLDLDVALDPELLGLVFENLLAEFDPNEDVARNARKNSGSYYTPREVIEFMVNDSLVLYLENKAKEQGIHSYSESIRFLVYLSVVNEKDNRFNEFVVNALDQIRILDPACGSGAFPMGMLHKISDILKLVDKDNSRWIKLKLENVEEPYKEEFENNLRSHYDDYSRKLGILRDSIFGLDIMPLAAHIAKLRFFISLIVHQKTDATKPNFGVTPLPNLETNILCVDSLKDEQPDIFSIDAVSKLSASMQNYYRTEHTREEKEELAKTIACELYEAYKDFHWVEKKDTTERSIEFWKRWFQFGNVTCPFFHIECFFPQVYQRGGFDIVIGNPPYGGNPIDKNLQMLLQIDSRDPYGAFMARYLRFFLDNNAVLKPGGILTYIVSDTFMTIKSHKALRELMLSNYIHKMIRMHPDTFKQVVNTVVFLCQKAEEDSVVPDTHECLMVDMTNISIRNKYDEFMDILLSVEDKDCIEERSDRVFAIYKYSQNIINSCTLKPFFVASPKLFVFMQDERVSRDNNDPNKRHIAINDNIVSVSKLNDIAEVTKGMDTGDNNSYLFQEPESGKHYCDISNYREFTLSSDELEMISNNPIIREKLISHGFHKNTKESAFDADRWFGGKYIIPYDKGAASDTSNNWLPNYYSPTDYYIDWSTWAVNRMKTLTRRMRDGSNSDSMCATFRNVRTFFETGITFSITGQYAPTFRLNSRSVYDNKGSMIILRKNGYNIDWLLSILCSKLIKMFSKAYIYHVVDMQVDAIKEIPILSNMDKRLTTLSQSIISKQMENLRYDYAVNEQIEIDRIVYELFGLQKEDIKEVENWYARRYPRLAGYELLDSKEPLPTS